MQCAYPLPSPLMPSHVPRLSPCPVQKIDGLYCLDGTILHRECKGQKFTQFGKGSFSCCYLNRGSEELGAVLLLAGLVIPGNYIIRTFVL